MHGDIELIDDGRQTKKKKKRRRPVSRFFSLPPLSHLPPLPSHFFSNPHRQENIAAESALMVPDTRQRLAAVVADTRKLLVREKERERERVGFFPSFFYSSEQLSLSLSLSLFPASLSLTHAFSTSQNKKQPRRTNPTSPKHQRKTSKRRGRQRRPPRPLSPRPQRTESDFFFFRFFDLFHVFPSSFPFFRRKKNVNRFQVKKFLLITASLAQKQKKRRRRRKRRRRPLFFFFLKKENDVVFPFHSSFPNFPFSPLLTLLPPLRRPLQHKVPEGPHLLVAQPRGEGARPLRSAVDAVTRHLPLPRVDHLEDLFGRDQAVAVEVVLEESVPGRDDVSSAGVAARAVFGEERSCGGVRS